MNPKFKGAFWALCAACLISGAGCQRTVIPEAGLSEQELTKTSATRVLMNGRSEWIVAHAPTTERTRWIVIELDGERKLFWAIERGPRTVELLPVVATSQDWIRRAVAEAKSVEFISALEDADLTHPVGVLEPGTQDVVWLGAAPSGAVSAVLVGFDAHEGRRDLLAAVRGVGSVDAASTFTPDLPVTLGPEDKRVLVFADGPVTPPTLRVGVVGSSPLGLPATFDAMPIEWSVDTQKFYANVRQRELLEFGVDVAVVERGDEFFVMPADPLSASKAPTGLLEVGVRVADAESVALYLMALKKLEGSNPLSAAYLAQKSGAKIGDDAYSTRLRAQELLGAAGFTQWMYVAHASGRERLDAPEFLFLSRAATAQGERERALAWSSDAVDVFSRWRTPARELGMGAARMAWARAAVLDRSPEALSAGLESARRASEDYKRGGDAIRAARAEQFAAAIASQMGEFEEAIIEAGRARSRFYYAHDVYACAQAELEMAELYLSQGLRDEAVKLATTGRMRMESLGSELGSTRGKVVEALVASRFTPDSVVFSELEGAHVASTKLGDTYGVLSAASVLVLLHPALEPAALARYGQELHDARPRVRDDLLRERVDRAFATACAQGLVDVVGGGKSSLIADCEQALDGFVPGDGLVLSWLSKGYSSLLQGRGDEAMSMGARLEALLVGPLVHDRPELAARINLFLAARATSNGDKEAGDAFDAAARANVVAIDRNLRSQKVRSLAADAISRGEAERAVWLLQEAARVADEAGQRDLGIAARFELLDVSFELGRVPDGVIEQIRAASTAKEHAVLAQALVYEAHASWIAGTSVAGINKRIDAAIAVVPVEDRVAVRVVDAEFALSRGDVSRAATVVESALLDVEQEREKSTDPELGRLEARALSQRANIQLLRGAFDRAFVDASEAVALVADDPTGASVEIAAGSYLLMLRAASDDVRARQAIVGLERLVSTQSANFGARVTDPERHRGAVASARSLARARYLVGDSAGAKQSLDMLANAGLSPRGELARVGCERGMIAMSVGDFSRGERELEQCVASTTGLEARWAQLARLLYSSEDAEQVRRFVDETFAQFGPRLTSRQRARLELILESSQTRSSNRLSKLRRSVERAKGDAKIAAANLALTQELIATGAHEEASSLIERNKSLYYRLDGDWPAELVRLNVQLRLSRLEVAEGTVYLQRALTELDVESVRLDISINLLAARSILMLGQYQQALPHLRDAKLAALELGDRTMVTTIHDLARRFNLDVDDSP